MPETPDSSLKRLLTDNGVLNWDILLIGDGSGSGAVQPCGWAVTIIDRATGLRRMLVGAQSIGSIAIGELLPYVMAMDHFDSVIRSPIHRKDLKEPFHLEVHIFTDSQHTAQAGNNVHSRACHSGLWAAIEHFEKNGYTIHWHFFAEGRNNPFQLHRLMDEMSSEGRDRLKDIEQPLELYELLP